MASTTAAISRVFTTRVGKTLTVAVRVPEPTEDAPEANANLSAYRGRLQIRDLRGRGRVLLDALESPNGTANAVLQRTSPGSWLITLGKKYTSWLPYKSVLELELENITNSDDVKPLLSTPLHISPEQVTNT